MMTKGFPVRQGANNTPFGNRELRLGAAGGPR